jgi:hypothetical protein
MNSQQLRPSLRETARRGAEANRLAREREVTPPPTQKTTPAPANPVAVAVTAMVAATCGHEVAVGRCPPAFLAARRAKLTGQPCPECRLSAQRARESTEQAAAQLRRRERASRRPRPDPRITRLPHGATFHVVFDAAAVKWTGTLTVPRGGIYNGSVTAGEDAAVFALLTKLDRAYRGLPDGNAAAETTP